MIVFSGQSSNIIYIKIKKTLMCPLKGLSFVPPKRKIPSMHFQHFHIIIMKNSIVFLIKVLNLVMWNNMVGIFLWYKLTSVPFLSRRHNLYLASPPETHPMETHRNRLIWGRLKKCDLCSATNERDGFLFRVQNFETTQCKVTKFYSKFYNNKLNLLKFGV